MSLKCVTVRQCNYFVVAVNSVTPAVTLEARVSFWASSCIWGGQSVAETVFSGYYHFPLSVLCRHYSLLRCHSSLIPPRRYINLALNRRLNAPPLPTFSRSVCQHFAVLWIMLLSLTSVKSKSESTFLSSSPQFPNTHCFLKVPRL
jgi:hypothetical protein